MDKKSSKTRTLGPVSAKFLDELHKCELSIFTLRDAAEIYGKTRYETVKFLSDLIKRGILMRLKSGVYLVIESNKKNVQLTNWPVIARELADRQNYFISHYSAMRIHGMTTHPLLDVYVTLPRRRTIKEIGNMSYHFIYSKPENFWGGYDCWVSRHEKVLVSNVERTLLDGLARPEPGLSRQRR